MYPPHAGGKPYTARTFSNTIRITPEPRSTTPPDAPYSLEGGDIMNLSESVLAVGISQRTMPEAIEQLARNIFSRPESKIQTILAMSIPSKRAFMHLDTVMTQVDIDKFVVHPAILPTLQIFELTRGKGGELTARLFDMDLAHTLAHYLQLDQVTLILCGGQDQIAAQRDSGTTAPIPSASVRAL